MMGWVDLLTPSHPSGGEGWGEGVDTTPSQLSQYGAKHAINVAHNFSVREPEHAIASLFQFQRPRRVITFAACMSVAIELDHEPLAASSEIGNVRCKNNLSLKFCAEPVRPKMIPESSFRLRQIAPQFLGTSSRLLVPFQASPSPFPLPLKGERGDIRHGRNSLQRKPAVNA